MVKKTQQTSANQITGLQQTEMAKEGRALVEFLGSEKSRAPAPGTRGPAPIPGASGRKVGADMTPSSVLYVAAAHSALMSSRAGCDLRGVAAAGQAVMCGPLAVRGMC